MLSACLGYVFVEAAESTLATMLADSMSAAVTVHFHVISQHILLFKVHFIITKICSSSR